MLKEYLSKDLAPVKLRGALFYITDAARVGQSMSHFWPTKTMQGVALRSKSDGVYRQSDSGSMSFICRAFRTDDDVLTFFIPPPPFIR